MAAVVVPFVVVKSKTIGVALWTGIELSLFVTRDKLNMKSFPSVSDILSIKITIAIISLQSLSGLSGLSSFGKLNGVWLFVGLTKFILLSKASSKPSLSASILEKTVSEIPSAFISQASITSFLISLSELTSK